MNPNTDQRSMRVYASDNTQYRTEPNEEQTRNGVVPLDSLPAAWWNWLWNEITSNNNNALLSITDLRTEIGNVLTNAGITASAQVTNQLAQAIIVIHQRKPFFDDQHNPVPGSVISSAARNSVSVDGSTGQMTVNALSDWVSQDSVKTVIDNLINGGSSSIASLEQDIADLNQKTGSLSSLSTTDKSNLVAAINEVDSHADSNAQAISDEATARQNADSSLSQAISDETTARQNADGTLANLTTTDKSNLVAAINEVNDKVNLVQYSTSEFDTKKKWMDGKKIYGRVLTDLSIRFSQGTSFPSTYTIRCMAVRNNVLYVGTDSHGIYTSTDGITFTQNTSFPTTYSVRAIAIVKDNIYVGTASHGIYTSTDGTTFTQNGTFPNTYTVLSMIGFAGKVIVGTSSHGIYTSAGDLDGQAFTQHTSFTTESVYALYSYNDVLYVCGINTDRIYASFDGGTTFVPFEYIFQSRLAAVTEFNDNLYIGIRALYTHGGLYTALSGTNIRKLDNFFPSSYSVQALYKYAGYLFIGTVAQGIYMSRDGTSFTQNASFPTATEIFSFCEFNGKLFVGTYQHGIYTSPGIASSTDLSGISELLFTHLRGSVGPLGLKSAHIDSSNHLVVEGNGTPTQAIIEYTKTT